MGWKTWPYWLKGGLIGLIFGVIALLIIPFYISDCPSATIKGVGCINGSMMPIYYISFWLLNFADNTLNLEPIFGGFLFVLIPIAYVLYGIVIGFIIGKIKSK